jgi:MoxR-like ATPase
VNRQTEVDLMTVCAVAQEPLLFVGPPGTAKSDLVVKWVESVGLGDDDYFEYMLTKFTEPSEILGPIDIDLLKQGRFIHRTKGKLPECRVAFLDEIFKSNSAILNLLLTILNERKFYQDGEPVPVGLQVLFGATNDIPEQSELDAMSDRFILKVETKPVKDTHFAELIDAGMRNEALRASKYLGRALWRPLSAASFGCACRAMDGADTTAEVAQRRKCPRRFSRTGGVHRLTSWRGLPGAWCGSGPRATLCQH